MQANEQISGFFSKAVQDDRIGTNHILVYMVLIRFWMNNGCENPFSVSRKQIMRDGKIKGLATYHKYIRELNDFGYIRYFPSYHPVWASTIYILKVIAKDVQINILPSATSVSARSA